MQNDYYNKLKGASSLFLKSEHDGDNDAHNLKMPLGIKTTPVGTKYYDEKDVTRQINTTSKGLISLEDSQPLQLNFSQWYRSLTPRTRADDDSRTSSGFATYLTEAMLPKNAYLHNIAKRQGNETHAYDKKTISDSWSSNKVKVIDDVAIVAYEDYTDVQRIDIDLDDLTFSQFALTQDEASPSDTLNTNDNTIGSLVGTTSLLGIPDTLNYERWNREKLPSRDIKDVHEIDPNDADAKSLIPYKASLHSVNFHDSFIRIDFGDFVGYFMYGGVVRNDLETAEWKSSYQAPDFSGPYSPTGIGDASVEDFTRRVNTTTLMYDTENGLKNTRSGVTTCKTGITSDRQFQGLDINNDAKFIDGTVVGRFYLVAGGMGEDGVAPAKKNLRGFGSTPKLPNELGMDSSNTNQYTIQLSIQKNSAAETTIVPSAEVQSVTGSGPSYTVNYFTDVSDVQIGDKVIVEKREYVTLGSSPVLSVYTYVVTALASDPLLRELTMRYESDTGGYGDDSPADLFSGGGSSGSPEIAPHKIIRSGSGGFNYIETSKTSRLYASTLDTNSVKFVKFKPVRKCGKVDVYQKKRSFVKYIDGNTITSPNHSLQTGDIINISNVMLSPENTGYTDIHPMNGEKYVRVVDDNNFEIFDDQFFQKPSFTLTESAASSTSSIHIRNITREDTGGGVFRWAGNNITYYAVGDTFDQEAQSWSYYTSLYSPSGRNGYRDFESDASSSYTYQSSYKHSSRLTEGLDFDFTKSFSDLVNTNFAENLYRKVPKKWADKNDIKHNYLNNPNNGYWNYYPYDVDNNDYDAYRGMNFGCDIDVKKDGDDIKLIVGEKGSDVSVDLCGVTNGYVRSFAVNKEEESLDVPDGLTNIDYVQFGERRILPSRAPYGKVHLFTIRRDSYKKITNVEFDRKDTYKGSGSRQPNPLDKELRYFYEPGGFLRFDSDGERIFPVGLNNTQKKYYQYSGNLNFLVNYDYTGLGNETSFYLNDYGEPTLGGEESSNVVSTPKFEDLYWLRSALMNWYRPDPRTKSGSGHSAAGFFDKYRKLKKSNHNRFENYGDDIDRRASETTQIVVGNEYFLAWQDEWQKSRLPFPEHKIPKDEYLIKACIPDFISPFVATPDNNRDGHRIVLYGEGFDGRNFGSDSLHGFDLYKFALARFHSKMDLSDDTELYHDFIKSDERRATRDSIVAKLDNLVYFDENEPARNAESIDAHYSGSNQQAIDFPGELAQSFRDIVLYTMALFVLRVDNVNASWAKISLPEFLFGKRDGLGYFPDGIWMQEAKWRSWGYSEDKIRTLSNEIKESKLTKLFGDEKLRLIKRALYPAYYYRNSFAVSTTWSPDFGNEYFKFRDLFFQQIDNIQQETHRIRNGVDRVAYSTHMTLKNLFSIIDPIQVFRTKQTQTHSDWKKTIYSLSPSDGQPLYPDYYNGLVSKVNTFYGVGWKMPKPERVDSFYGTHFYNIYSTKNRPSVKYPASADPAVADKYYRSHKDIFPDIKTSPLYKVKYLWPARDRMTTQMIFPFVDSFGKSIAFLPNGDGFVAASTTRQNIENKTSLARVYDMPSTETALEKTTLTNDDKRTIPGQLHYCYFRSVRALANTGREVFPITFNGKLGLVAGDTIYSLPEKERVTDEIFGLRLGMDGCRNAGLCIDAEEGSKKVLFNTAAEIRSLDFSSSVSSQVLDRTNYQDFRHDWTLLNQNLVGDYNTDSRQIENNKYFRCGTGVVGVQQGNQVSLYDLAKNDAPRITEIKSYVQNTDRQLYYLVTSQSQLDASWTEQEDGSVLFSGTLHFDIYKDRVITKDNYFYSLYALDTTAKDRERYTTRNRKYLADLYFGYSENMTYGDSSTLTYNYFGRNTTSFESKMAAGESSIGVDESCKVPVLFFDLKSDPNIIKKITVSFDADDQDIYSRFSYYGPNATGGSELISTHTPNNIIPRLVVYGEDPRKTMIKNEEPSSELSQEVLFNRVDNDFYGYNSNRFLIADNWSTSYSKKWSLSEISGTNDLPVLEWFFQPKFRAGAQDLFLYSRRYVGKALGGFVYPQNVTLLGAYSDLSGLVWGSPKMGVANPGVTNLFAVGPAGSYPLFSPPSEVSGLSPGEQYDIDGSPEYRSSTYFGESDLAKIRRLLVNFISDEFAYYDSYVPRGTSAYEFYVAGQNASKTEYPISSDPWAKLFMPVANDLRYSVVLDPSDFKDLIIDRTIDQKTRSRGNFHDGADFNDPSYMVNGYNNADPFKKRATTLSLGFLMTNYTDVKHNIAKLNPIDMPTHCTAPADAFRYEINNGDRRKHPIQPIVWDKEWEEVEGPETNQIGNYVKSIGPLTSLNLGSRYPYQNHCNFYNWKKFPFNQSPVFSWEGASMDYELRSMVKNINVEVETEEIIDNFISKVKTVGSVLHNGLLAQDKYYSLGEMGDGAVAIEIGDDTSTSTQDVFSTNIIKIDNNRSVKVVNDKLDFKDADLNTDDNRPDIVNNRNVSSSFSITKTDAGSERSLPAITLTIDGVIPFKERLDLRADGHESQTSNPNLFINGFTTDVIKADLFTGQRIRATGMPLMLKAPSFDTLTGDVNPPSLFIHEVAPSSTMSLHTSAPDFVADMSLNIAAPISGSVPLVAFGPIQKTNTMDLTMVPAASGEFTMFVRPFDFASGDITLQIDAVGSGNSEMTLSFAAPESGNINLNTLGSVPSSGNISLFMADAIALKNTDMPLRMVSTEEARTDMFIMSERYMNADMKTYIAPPYPAIGPILDANISGPFRYNSNDDGMNLVMRAFFESGIMNLVTKPIGYSSGLMSLFLEDTHGVMPLHINQFENTPVAPLYTDGDPADFNSGMGLHLDSSYDSGVMESFIHGKSPFNADASLAIFDATVGKPHTLKTPLFIGKEIYANRDMSLNISSLETIGTAGATGVSTQISAFINPTTNATKVNESELFIAAPISGGANVDIPMFVGVEEAVFSENGNVISSGNVDFVIAGNNNANANSPRTLHNSDMSLNISNVGQASGDMPLFMARETEDAATLYIGSFTESSQINVYISGANIASGNMDLYIAPPTSIETELFTRGYLE